MKKSNLSYPLIFVALILLIVPSSHSSLITTTTSGNLMFEYLWGEAGPSLQEFGLGTPDTNSTPEQREVIFKINYRDNGTVAPASIVNMGYFYAGSSLDFYNLSDWQGPLYAFSSNLENSPTLSDLAVFQDTNNSLNLGGSIVKNLGVDVWELYLDDAWSYKYDDDDNEMVIRVWVDQSAGPPINPVPEPATIFLMGVGTAFMGAIIRSTKRKEKAPLTSSL